MYIHIVWAVGAANGLAECARIDAHLVGPGAPPKFVRAAFCPRGQPVALSLLWRLRLRSAGRRSTQSLQIAVAPDCIIPRYRNIALQSSHSACCWDKNTTEYFVMTQLQRCSVSTRVLLSSQHLLGVEETLLEMWDCYKYSDQSVAPNAAHPHFPPDAEVIVVHNQKIAIRQVAGVAGACCTW